MTEVRNRGKDMGRRETNDEESWRRGEKRQEINEGGRRRRRGNGGADVRREK